MLTTGQVVRIALAAASACVLAGPVRADDAITPAQAAAAQEGVSKAAAPGVIGKLTVTVGKSLTIDSPLAIKRLSTANGNLVEAVAIGPKEVLINGKQPGETSLIIWQDNDARLIYDLTVRMSPQRLNAAREQIARDFPDADINVTFDNDTAFVRGTVRDMVSSDRIMAIVGTLGKAVNLLRVDVPPVESQILLKVRFADVDRSASLNLSANFLSGAFNQTTAIGTGATLGTDAATVGTVGTLVNIFAMRKDINLQAAITALESKNLLEILAEPNLVTVNNKPASFTAGGEFPYPMIQPGSSGGGTSVTITFKEYGIRLNFLPTITPRGTIRLHVAPEVSSLDYTNAVTLQGFTIPGMSVRKVETEIELDSGQSFVIAGLLDKQVTDSFSKIPGLGSIPILGKLFQSKSVTKNNSELLVIITPELVRPIPGQQPVPELRIVKPFMGDNTGGFMGQPGMDKTGPVPVHPPNPTLPVEQLIQTMPRPGQAAPVPTPSAPPATGTGGGTDNPGQTPPAAPPPGGGGGGGGNGE
ncbi:MAG: pilus assembly protein N-terminal domain-containing protein [Bryobacteraceae bacterium]|jgi:pilus assembly protein CpaC